MSWGDVNLSELTTDVKVVPEGQKYTFELLKGARFSKFDSARVDAGAKIVDGEYAGTVIWFSYPDPSKYDWVTGVFARTMKALELAPEPNEDPVTYLNRAAGRQFVAPVKHRPVEVEGVTTPKAEINIMNIRAFKG